MCQNNICVPEVKCRTNNDCGSNERCRQNSVGQAECKEVCDNLVLCSRNAICIPKSHEAVCECPQGYFGDPIDDKVGCQKIDCRTDEQCAQDQKCDNFKCKSKFTP